MIDTFNGHKKLHVAVTPQDAFYPGADVEIVDNQANARLSSSLNLTVDTTLNETVTVRAKAKDNSGVYDEIAITIINQHTLVEDMNNPGVKYYPNPVSDYMNVEFPEFIHARLTIRNVRGSIVRQAGMYSDRTLINTTDLANGVYFVTVESAGKTDAFRFVKE